MSYASPGSISVANFGASERVEAPEITLDTFASTHWSLNDLIAGLTEPLIDADKSRAVAGQAFDPKPFIGSLEGALEALLPLRKRVAAETAERERAVTAAERGYGSKLRELRNHFEAVSTSFGSLESRIGEVGRTAIRIGEQLESIDRLRARASDAHDIIMYYHEFARGDTSRLDALRKDGGREGRAKVATIARRLAAVAREVEGVEGGETTRDTIDKYCERFEKDMLKLFDRYYRKGDPKMMAHCARTLQDFNGGASCVQIYVNQHDFFISKDRVQDAALLPPGSAIAQALPDPDAPAPRTEPGLTSLFDEIRLTVGQEAQIVQAVFPQPAVVMQVFLQRVFAQVVEQYLERLMSAASALSALALLRVLQLAHRCTHELVNDLKAHDFFKQAPSSGSSSVVLGLAQPTVATAVASASTGSGVGSLAAVTATLDTALEELFERYIGAAYLDKESKSLAELYATNLLQFVAWHARHSKVKGATTNMGVFDRVAKQLASAASAAPVPGSPSIGSAASGLPVGSGLKQLMKLGGMRVDDSPDPAGALPASVEGDGVLRLEVAEHMLKWHAEAVGRMVELSPPSDVPKNAFALLRVLSDSFGRAYIETALDTAISHISNSDPKLEPDLSPLSVVALADMTMHLWQHYVATALLPLAGPSVAIRREMGIFNNHVVVRIEGKINEVVQRATDAIVAWLAVLLARQKKLDFRPKDDSVALDRPNTEPCLAGSAFLQRVRDAAFATLTGRNREVFLSEVGITFHGLLLEHLRKFQVSAAGGLMLTKDLAVYQDTLATYDVPIVAERFEMLRQLGNLFLISPDTIKQYMSESHLARVDDRLLRPYLMQRADWSDYPRAFVQSPDELTVSAKFWQEVCGAGDRGAGDRGAGDPLAASGPPSAPQRTGGRLTSLASLVSTGND